MWTIAGGGVSNIGDIRVLKLCPQNYGLRDFCHGASNVAKCCQLSSI